MRRALVCAVIASLAVLAAVAAPAGASFHLNTVNEVGLAKGGPAAQFVELFDPVAEPYPDSFAPYSVVIFDAAGHKLGGVPVSTATLRAKASLTPVLVGTAAADAAFGTTRDATLPVALPASAGQACFTQGSAESVVSCMAWGCVTHAVQDGAPSTAPPPDGMSAQAEPDGTVGIAAPTPGKANASGPSSAACPGGGGGKDTTKPKASFKGTPKALAPRVKTNESGKLSATLTLSKATAKKLGLSGHARIASGHLTAVHAGTYRIKLKLTARAKHRLSRHTVRAKLVVAVSDPDHNTRHLTRTVKLNVP